MKFRTQLLHWQAVGQAVSDDYRYAFAINEGDGRVTVNTTLDASQYNYYEYTLVATVCVLPDNYKIIVYEKKVIYFCEKSFFFLSFQICTYFCR